MYFSSVRLFTKHTCCAQTRPQEATFLTSLLHHQPQLRPTVDALLRSNLLPALHASLSSRRSGAAAPVAQPSSPVSASSAAPAVARPSLAADPQRVGEAQTASAAAGRVKGSDVAVDAAADAEAAAQRRQAVAAAAEDKEVCNDGQRSATERAHQAWIQVRVGVRVRALAWHGSIPQHA